MRATEEREKEGIQRRTERLGEGEGNTEKRKIGNTIKGWGGSG